jgi:hypothetical protein
VSGWEQPDEKSIPSIIHERQFDRETSRLSPPPKIQRSVADALRLKIFYPSLGLKATCTARRMATCRSYQHQQVTNTQAPNIPRLQSLIDQQTNRPGTFDLMPLSSTNFALRTRTYALWFSPFTMHKLLPLAAFRLHEYVRLFCLANNARIRSSSSEYAAHRGREHPARVSAIRIMRSHAPLILLGIRMHPRYCAKLEF